MSGLTGVTAVAGGGYHSLALKLTAAATTTTVSGSPNPAAVGQSVTYTAQVSPTPDGGTMAFSDNGTTISGCGSVSVDTTTGKATCTTTYGVGGSHAIAATYSGDANYSGSTSPTSGVDGLTETVQAAVPVPVTGAAPGGGSLGVLPWGFGLLAFFGGLLAAARWRRGVMIRRAQ